MTHTPIQRVEIYETVEFIPYQVWLWRPIKKKSCKITESDGENNFSIKYKKLKSMLEKGPQIIREEEPKSDNDDAKTA